jgi:hypothetical protein
MCGLGRDEAILSKVLFVFVLITLCELVQFGQKIMGVNL